MFQQDLFGKTAFSGRLEKENMVFREVFPTEWKKANVVPFHKKGEKQILKKCRSISLLSIAGKIFERLFYDRVFEFFIENNFISKNQSVRFYTR